MYLLFMLSIFVFQLKEKMEKPADSLIKRSVINWLFSYYLLKAQEKKYIYTKEFIKKGNITEVHHPKAGRKKRVEVGSSTSSSKNNLLFVGLISKYRVIGPNFSLRPNELN